MQVREEDVSSAGRSCCICTPSGRMPVPASSTIACPLSRRTSTHEVLPPYRTVSAPGAASEPRHPQMRARISRWIPSASPSQNTAITPCMSPVVANSGYAVASNGRRTPSKVVAMTDACAGRCWKNAMPAGELRRRSAHRRVSRARASRRTRRPGSRRARRTACRAGARRRRCRRRACPPASRRNIGVARFEANSRARISGRLLGAAPGLLMGASSPWRSRLPSAAPSRLPEGELRVARQVVDVEGHDERVGLGWVIARASTHGAGTATPAPGVEQNGTSDPTLGLSGSTFL